MHRLYVSRRPSNGIFRVVGTVNGKRFDRSLRTRDKAEAQKRFDALKQDLAANEALEHVDALTPGGIGGISPVLGALRSATGADSRRSVSSVLERYLTESRDRKREKTCKDAEFLLRRFVRDTGVEKVSEISRDVVIDYMRRLRSSGRSPVTANRYRIEIHAMLEWARRSGLVTVNPVSSVPRHAEPQQEIVFLSDLQIAQQLKVLAADPVSQALVAAMVFAGLRRTEPFMLTIDDVDLTPWPQCPYGVIHIRPKVIQGRRWQPKTGRSRTIPVSEALHPYLVAQKVRSGHELFFPSPTGKIWDPKNWYQRRLKSVNESAGLMWKPSHFRHTFATDLIRRGVSTAQISVLMGNSERVVLSNYANLKPEGLYGVMERSQDQIELFKDIQAAS